MDHLRQQLDRLRGASMLAKGAIAEDALIAAVAVLSDQEGRLARLERMAADHDAALMQRRAL
jgi:hypothetical protein